MSPPFRLSLLAVISLTLWVRLVTAEAFASAYDYGFDVNRRVRRRMEDVAQGTPLVTRGGGTAGGSEAPLPLRQELRVLEQDQDQWTLYMLGLNFLQYMNQSSPTSWYGLTGIHGIPFDEWGGVSSTSGARFVGYCTHVSQLFPTWHRPYLALYEQVLFGVVQEIASWFPDAESRQRYEAAAANFRIPYWDWAANPPSGQSVLPLSVGGSPSVDVDGPNGVQTIANPLFDYTFKPLNATAFLEAPWDIWTSTVRMPTAYTAQAQSNNSWIAAAFDQNQLSIQQRLYNLFSNYGNYSLFSNEAWVPYPNNGSYDSLESLHDTVHNLAGGFYGHMAYIAYSAFDPIFFLHHCNIDRIFAMWQAVYPDSWIVPSNSRLATLTIAQSQEIDSTTALTPFFSDNNGSFWTSDRVRDHTVLGYTYPELAGNQQDGPGGLNGSAKALAQRAQVIKAINNLYGQSSPSKLAIEDSKARIRQPSSEARARGMARLVDRTKRLSSPPADARDIQSLPKPPARTVVVDRQYREWVVNIRVDKQALDEPFFIHFFFGAPTPSTGASAGGARPSPQSWAYAPNLVGTMSVFASDGKMMAKLTRMGGPGAAMDMADVHIAGTVPLTASLVQKVTSGRLGSLDASAVEPYLRKHLQHRVVRASGMAVDPSAVPTMAIHIASALVTAPLSEDKLPAWGQMEWHFDL